MRTAKQQVESLLHRLPEDCALEDIQYHLYVIGTVRGGLEDAQQRGTVPQEEVEKHLGKWLTEVESKIAEGYASAQRGELLDPDEVRAKLQGWKQAQSTDQQR